MGCAQSRIENEESVSRCKDRRQFMKDAVSARNAFAAAHSSFIIALKNTGAALSDFAQTESPDAAIPRAVPSPSPGAVAPPMDNLLPPPPPLPEFSPSPLQRSVSMPDLPKKYAGKSRRDDAIREEDDDDGGEAPEGTTPVPSPPPPPPSRAKGTPSPPPMPDSGGLRWDYFFSMDENMLMPGSSIGHVEEIQPADVTPEKAAAVKGGKKKEGGGVAHHQHAASSGALESKKGKLVAAANVSLLQVLKDLDEHFLRASESAHEVSKMLEATRMHYHSNFADNRGDIVVNPSFSYC